MAAALWILRNHPAVECVQPNWIYRHHLIPDEPNYAGRQLWGLYGDPTTPGNPFGSQAGKVGAIAVARNGGMFVTVASLVIGFGLRRDCLHLAAIVLWI